jgi:hypothetical protein
MKYLLPILLVCFQISIAANTTWHYCNTGYPSYPISSYIVGDSMILCNVRVGATEDCSFENKDVIALDLNGNFLWSADGGNFLTSDTSGIYIVCFSGEHDDMAGNVYIRIFKLDSEGNILLDYRYPENSSPGNIIMGLNNISVSPAGKILVCTYDELIVANQQGEIFMTKKYEDLSPFISADLSVYGGIWAVTKDSILGINANTGNIEFTYNSDFVIEDSWFIKDTLYLLSNHQIFLQSNFDGPYDTITLDATVQISDFKVFENKIWVIGEKDNNKVLYKVDIYNPANDSIIPVKTEEMDSLTDYNIVNDRAFFLGSLSFNQAAVQSYMLTETPQFSYPDLSIVDFSIDNISYKYIYITETDSFISGYYFDFELTVKNNGSDSIHSFAVYSRLDGEMNCSFNERYLEIENAQIAPEGELTINKSGFYQQLKNGTLCFTCLIPNDQMESELANNKLCKTFQIDDVSNNKETDKIKIYPNPSYDFLNLDFIDASEKEIKIVDMNGRVILNKLTSDLSVILPLKDIKPGIYCIRILSGNKISNKKFIIN